MLNNTVAFFLLLFALVVARPEPAAAQRWSVDSIVFDYPGCELDTTFHLWLINDADTAITVYSLTPQRDVSIDSLPQAWGSNQYGAIPPQDSVLVIIRHRSGVGGANVVHGGSLTADGTKAFFLQVRRQLPKLEYHFITSGFYSVKVGSPKTDSILLRNSGAVDFQLDSMHLMTNKGWFIAGLKPGDVLPSGSSIKLAVTFFPLAEGYATNQLMLYGSCISEVLHFPASAIIHGPRWTADRIDQNLRTCPGESLLEATLYNNSNSEVLVDSIRFVGDATGWVLVDPTPDGARLGASDSLSIVLNRQQGAPDINLGLYSAAGRDTIGVNITEQYPKPGFGFGGDTMIITVKPGESITNFASDLKNFGFAPFKIASVISSGDNRWLIDLPDTSSEIGLNARTPIYADFLGADEPGDYSVTLRVNTTPCDLSVSRTLIARVGQLGTTELVEANDILIYPTIVKSILHVECPVGASVVMTDLLGKEVERFWTTEVLTSIKTELIPNGNYFIYVESKGNSQSRMIRIARS